jgi:hypothetical protein
VHVSIIHIAKNQFEGQLLLDNMPVSYVSSRLDNIEVTGKPFALVNNNGKSFAGSYVLGMGFILDHQEAQNLISQNPKNKNVILPYLNGRDLNSQPNQYPTRHAIFFRDWGYEKVKEYPECLQIIRDRVYPERQKKTNKKQRDFWWQYKRPTMDLYEAIEPLQRVLVCSNVSSWLSFAFVPTHYVLNVNLCVFVTDKSEDFSLLQNTIHETWARKYSATLETRLKYSVINAYNIVKRVGSKIS